MRSPLLAPPLPSNVDTTGEQFRQNRDDVLEQLAVMEELLGQGEAGGDPESIARMRSCGNP